MTGFNAVPESQYLLIGKGNTDFTPNPVWSVSPVVHAAVPLLIVSVIKGEFQCVHQAPSQVDGRISA